MIVARRSQLVDVTWRGRLAAVVLALLATVVAGALSPAPAHGQAADDSPSTAPTPAATPDGEGEDRGDTNDTQGDVPTVRMARATWDTGWFQAEVYRQLLNRIGYRVEGPTTMENADFFADVASGDVDLWANGWFPLHQSLLSPGSRAVGVQVDDGARTGYFADSGSADEFGLTSLADLADPDVAARFDVDGNGLADLYGCNVEWACAPQVDHHIEVFGLGTTVEQVQADYAALMTEVIQRQRDGQPVLLYAFTPHWILAELPPGEALAWLEVPGADLPDQPDLTDADTALSGLDGCVRDPCQTGFPPNDIRAVANDDFLDANPSVRRLLEVVELPLADIQAQNDLMYRGQGSEEDIREQASGWIEDHASLVRDWVDSAAPDATPVTDGSGDGVVGGEPLRVVVRTLEPFVLYEQRSYSGYSVELADAIAARLGREVEVYGVNSVAKQLDDVARGVADIAVAAVSITSDREEHVDFSLPVFQTGLTILVPRESGDGLFERARDVGAVIFGSGLPWWILAFVVVLLLTAHAIWWLEHRDNPDFPSAYRHGIWDSFWWATVTVTTVGYGDKTPKGRRGQVFAVVWMIVGYFLFASFTASITSSLAINELRGSIAGPGDLTGNAVATLANSPAESWLVGEGIGPVSFGSMDEVYAALDEGEVDAVVFDAPVLQYRAARDSSVQTVGSPFDTVRYGIAIGDDEDELREQVNRALLELIESGAYDQLNTRWFGDLGD